VFSAESSLGGHKINHSSMLDSSAVGAEAVNSNERSDHPFTKRSGDMVYTSVLD